MHSLRNQTLGLVSWWYNTIVPVLQSGAASVLLLLCLQSRIGLMPTGHIVVPTVASVLTVKASFCFNLRRFAKGLPKVFKVFSILPPKVCYK